MNNNTEIAVRKCIQAGISEGVSTFKTELYEIFEKHVTLFDWYKTAKDGDNICLSEFYKDHKRNHEIIYFMHKYLRRQYEDVWTLIENDDFVVKKVSSTELAELQNTFNLDEDFISHLLGFTKVFRLLIYLKKPLVGHNLLQDILLMYESFESHLPHSYKTFKSLVHELFPIIFDTRVIAYDVARNIIPRDKRWNEKGLESIFDYFKNGTGRHLARNSPAIEQKENDGDGRFHEAGWDSFCTGYIFIRMAYLYIYEKYPKSKTFVACELIAATSHLKNQLNIIRGYNSTIVSVFL